MDNDKVLALIEAAKGVIDHRYQMGAPMTVDAWDRLVTALRDAQALTLHSGEAADEPVGYQILRNNVWEPCSHFVAFGWGDKMDENCRAIYAAHAPVTPVGDEPVACRYRTRVKIGRDFANEPWCAWSGWNFRENITELDGLIAHAEGKLDFEVEVIPLYTRASMPVKEGDPKQILLEALEVFLGYEGKEEFSIPYKTKRLVYSSDGLMTGATELGGQ